MSFKSYGTGTDKNSGAISSLSWNLGRFGACATATAAHTHNNNVQTLRIQSLYHEFVIDGKPRIVL